MNNYFSLTIEEQRQVLQAASRFGLNTLRRRQIQPENLSSFTSVQWTFSATETND